MNNEDNENENDEYFFGSCLIDCILLVFFYPENYFFLESNNDQWKTFNYFTVKSFLLSGKIIAKTVLILVGYI